MLKLDRVSKFYSQNGVVTSGFSKVSLGFRIGEFVAITGESGSGKSTLLNVISGLDSYEEGEMYIQGLPTSGYSSDDMEEYRKRYIGSIFQTFNLINNYTVYQNVELVLLLAGYSRGEVRERVEDIIRKVGLERYRKTKASKLSGGQKQRVAIARALAKETPIIVADEPTGNLDVESAREIIELLASLSDEKLIIIVTHNYEQVEDLVTRRITMRDGRVIEDKRFEREEETVSGEEHVRPEEARHDNLTAGSTLRLGVRNTFSLPVKFLLLLVVFLFLCTGTFSSYSSFQNMKLAVSDISYSTTFSNTDPRRIIVTKPDKAAFSQEDYDRLNAIANVSSIVRDDPMLDAMFNISNKTQAQLETLWQSGSDEEYIYLQCNVKSLDGLEDRIEEGRLPENANETFLLFSRGKWDGEYLSSYIDRSLYVTTRELGAPVAQGCDDSLTVVGYGYYTEKEEEEKAMQMIFSDATLCVGDEAVNMLNAQVTCVRTSHTLTVNSDAVNIVNAGSGTTYPFIGSQYVDQGTVMIPENIAALYKDSKAKGKPLTVGTKNLYFSKTNDFKVDAVYTASNSQKLLDLKYDDMTKGIYMNPEDIRAFYATSEKYQISVMMENTIFRETTIKEIKDAGYKALYVHDASMMNSVELKGVLNAIRTVVLVVLLAVLFFVSYFIIKLIFKSQNVYFSTVRMLGGSRGGCSKLLLVDMLTVFHIAFAAVSVYLFKVKDGTLSSIGWIENLVQYVEGKDYIILYAVILFLTVLLAVRYSSQMFRKTAMNAYREEV